MKYKIPEKIESEISKCNQCGKCLSVCPTYWITNDECDSARGLLELIKNANTGNLPITQKYLEHLYRCSSCRACAEVCPSNIAIFEVIDWAKCRILEVRSEKLSAQRRDLAKGGAVRKIPYTAVTEDWKTYVNKQLVKKQNRESFLKSIPEIVGKKTAKHRVGFFIGCLMDIGYQDTAKNIVNWLVNQNYAVVIPKGQECCGMPAISLGAIDAAKDKIANNIRVFTQAKVKTIVTGCPHCAVMIRDKWSSIAGNLPFQVIHIAELVAKSGINPDAGKHKGERVGYQPACHLHRALGLPSNLNTIFKKPIPNYIETKNSISCCGQAGINGFLYPEIATQIASRQVNRLNRAKLDCLLTNCPWCNLIFDKQKDKQFILRSLIEY
ncbi:MAG: (Fe-S)-binding protein [bacterium]